MSSFFGFPVIFIRKKEPCEFHSITSIYGTSEPDQSTLMKWLRHYFGRWDSRLWQQDVLCNLSFEASQLKCGRRWWISHPFPKTILACQYHRSWKAQTSEWSTPRISSESWLANITSSESREQASGQHSAFQISCHKRAVPTDHFVSKEPTWPRVHRWSAISNLWNLILTKLRAFACKFFRCTFQTKYQSTSLSIFKLGAS